MASVPTETSGNSGAERTATKECQRLRAAPSSALRPQGRRSPIALPPHRPPSLHPAASGSRRGREWVALGAQSVQASEGGDKGDPFLGVGR